MPNNTSEYKNTNFSIYGLNLYSQRIFETYTEYRILGIKIKKSKKNKIIAVIRLNGLGDYILMHNFLHYIKKSPKYKDYKLVVITWSHFSSLIEKIDSSCVDEFVWLDSSFGKSWGMKYLKKKFSCYKFDTILSPVISDFADTEKVLSIMRAPNIIGQECLKDEKCTKNKKLYTEILQPLSGLMSEFERNRSFFERVLDLKINIESPYFENDFDFDKKYIFFSPFAGDVKRTWSKNNFASIINYVIEKYKYKCVILGAKYDAKAVLDILSGIESKNMKYVINAVGRISTVDLPQILKNNAKLLIANETGTVHVAAAVNCPFLVVSNGRFYKRFQPYRGLEDSYIYPPKLEFLLKNGEDVSYYYNKTDLEINDIQINDLIPRIDMRLQEGCFDRD